MSTETMPVVSATCEHVQVFNPTPKYCGLPTQFWYHAAGGGTMALCTGHAIPLLPRHYGLHEYAELSL